MAGTITRFLVTHDVVAAHLVVMDAWGKRWVFELAADARINGKRIRCTSPGASGWEQFAKDEGWCAKIPQLHPGARVLVHYYRAEPGVIGAKLAEVPGSGTYGANEITVLP